MQKEKLVRGVKLLLIFFLILIITSISLLQWKSDWIMAQVVTNIESQLTDTLHYEAVHMDVFSHFPCIAVTFKELRIGSHPIPLIDHGGVDVVIRIMPLSRGEIHIDHIRVADAQINIAHTGGRWTYDLLKKEANHTESTSWKTRIHQLQIHDSNLFYTDGKKTEFELSLEQVKVQGEIDPELLDIDLAVTASLNRLSLSSYSLPQPFSFTLSGKYVFDFTEGLQHFEKWIIDHEAVSLTMEGSIKREASYETYALTGGWSKAKPNELRKWLPEQQARSFKPYKFFGESKGEYSLTGPWTSAAYPEIRLNGKWVGGGIGTSSSPAEFKNVNVDFDYLSSDPKHKKKSTLTLHVEKKSLTDTDLTGQIFCLDLKHPVLDIDLQGTLPAELLNIVSWPGFQVDQGDLIFEACQLHQFSLSGDLFSQLVEKGNFRIQSKSLSCTYLHNAIEWKNATLNSTPGSGVHVEFDVLTWSQATARALRGDLVAKGNQIQFHFESDFCGGKVISKGKLESLARQHTFRADWTLQGIEIRSLLESFSNFDQTFLTADQLSGTANVWAMTTIPMDAGWKIKPKEISSSSAIEIKDGRLKNMKTLEDFSRYIHVEDLRDIHFSQLRNYLKIENGQVYIPVMFIQSSAMNLSIGGVHGFDQKILYNLKINAGQTLGNKLKKTDFRKELKPAAKSGWINMYFVLEGTTTAVRYQQYRQAVISGFEQSAQLKENLRRDLVDHFGYEVYWLEPNAWEDIPEYK